MAKKIWMFFWGLNFVMSAIIVFGLVIALPLSYFDPSIGARGDLMHQIDHKLLSMMIAMSAMGFRFDWLCPWAGDKL